MQPLSYFGVSKKQVSTNPVDVLKIEGTFVGDTASWIQVHDSYIEPASSAVPLKSYYVAVGSTTPQPFRADFIAGEMPLVNGLFVGVSSTEGSYTAASKNMDLEVELRQPPRNISNVIGDTTTGVNYRQIWTTPSSAQRLCKITVIPLSTDSDDAALYLLMFAKNQADVSVGDIPIWHSPSFAPDADPITFDFGDRGISPYQQSASGTGYDGCLLILSTSASTYQAPIDSNACAILAEFKGISNP